MNVRVLAEAESEALDAACWYDQQAGLGDHFLDLYEKKLSEIEERPLALSTAGDAESQAK